MKNTLAFTLILTLFGCSIEITPDPAPTEPVCASVQKCMAREAGYVWAGLSTSKVGECTFYRYTCVPNGEAADEACEQRWETVCAPGDVDAAGERGE